MPHEGHMNKCQQVLAYLGTFALHSDDLGAVLTEACQLVAEGLGTERAKVLEVEEQGAALCVRAGIGWDEAVASRARLRMSPHSSETRSIETGEPVISGDILPMIASTFPTS